MKKKLVVLCIVGFLAVPVFADHSGSQVGLGLYLGGGFGSAAGGVFNPGVSLKIPGMPLFWGVNIGIGGGVLGLDVSGDYYFIDQDLVKDGSFNLDWFLGLGGFGHFAFGSNFAFALGVRLPVGLSWHINKTFELFADVVPGIGIGFTSPVGFYWAGAGELGLRVWL
ncbi:MAG: hypothetical protein LBI94_07890 [Treponema sp.]|jgi:hypothetical protein|nr:hypothetical protein [Treponema sp.]